VKGLYLTRKFDQAIKKSKINDVVEYLIWVFIKRTLTGKLAVDGRNFIHCVQFEVNVTKKIRPFSELSYF